MSEYIYKEHTEGNLPHYHPPDATLFVTFRLAETIPKPVLRIYRARKQWLEEETRRTIALKLKDDSPEMEAHDRRLLEFRQEWFVKFEEILHKAETGPTWLKDEQIPRSSPRSCTIATARFIASTPTALCPIMFISLCALSDGGRTARDFASRRVAFHQQKSSARQDYEIAQGLLGV